MGDDCVVNNAVASIEFLGRCLTICLEDREAVRKDAPASLERTRRENAVGIPGRSER